MIKTKKSAIKIPRKLQRAAFSALLMAILLTSLWIARAVSTVNLPTSEHPVEFFANQQRDDLQLAFEKAFQSAKKSILVIIYTINDPQIIKTLKQKAEEGIDVQVICDSKASYNAQKKLGPKVKTLRRASPGLMHQKIVVIDERDCWIGSANFTTDSLRVHGNLVTAMRSEAMAKTIIEKSKEMPKKGRSTPFFKSEYLFNNQKMELWFLPDNPEALDRLKNLIRGAEKTMRIAMFTWTHPGITQEVIDAKKRGVDVQVVIDHYAGKGSSAEVVKMLKDSGVNTRLSQGNALLHYKLLVRDGNVLVNGSANWTRAAFSQNDDCFIVLHDLTEKQRNKLDDLWSIIWGEAK